jgi:hypothetical protein
MTEPSTGPTTGPHQPTARTIRGRTTQEIRNYDTGKAVVTGILALLLLRPLVAVTTGTITPAASVAATPANYRPPTLMPLDSVRVGEPVVLNGEGTPNTRVDILNNNVKIGETTVTGDGKWSLSAVFPSDQGGTIANLMPVGINTDGSNLGSGGQVAVQVLAARNSNPDAPAVTSPAAGTVLSSNVIDLSGTGPKDGIVEVVANGNALGAVPIGSDGTWRFSADLPSVGDYQIRARTLKANRQVLAEGNAFKVTVPASVTITSACPCRLRISTPAAGATITLVGASQTGPQALFSDLKAGEYVYTVSAPKHKSYTGKATTPKNRSLSVWLERVAR